MKLKYIKEYRCSEYKEGKFFKPENEYEVLADYRKRTSNQKIPDDGFVVVDDLGTQRMVFLKDGFILSEREGAKTFVFIY